jgi:hypothetical protein
MTASEKFEARLHELGLYNEWLEQGGFGRIGIELVQEDKIVILVHESEEDAYTEFTYPPMCEMAQDEDFRRRALIEFVDAGDETFIRNLIRWYLRPSCKCPLFPVDAYFIWQNYIYTDFEDDVEEKEAESKQISLFHKDGDPIEEWCVHCDTCAHIEDEFKVQRCPNCGKWIVPCFICPLQSCARPCPLDRLATMLNED